MNVTTRVAAAAAAVLAAASIAAGCGGSGGSGAAAAAKDSAGLDFIPKDAIGYVVVDADLGGEGWKRFDELALAFDPEFKGMQETIDAESDKEGEEVSFEEDIEPWLGESAGAAMYAATGPASDGASSDDDADAGDGATEEDPVESADAAEGEEMEIGEGAADSGAASDDTSDAASDDTSDAGSDEPLMMWVELEDRGAFEQFLEKRGAEKDDKLGDYETWSNPEDETFVAVSDDLALLTPSRAGLEQVVEFEDGDSITDADGIDDVLDAAEGDALVTLVVSGHGVRTAAEEDEDYAAIADNEELKAFQGMSVSFTAEDEGFRAHGFAGFDGIEDAVLGENSGNELFGDLPADTLFAIGGQDFGGQLKSAAESAGDASPQVAQGIGAGTGALGVSLDDIEKAFDGEFALGIAGDDGGLQKLLGGAMGAFMGGGDVSGLDGSFLQSSSLVLALENGDDTAETLDKIVTSAGGLAGGGTPEEGTSGDFETKTLTVMNVPIVSATSDDVSALAFGRDVMEDWGDEPLADSDAYKDAWDASGAPDEVSGSFWLDWPRVATLAGRQQGEDVTAGGWVGWTETDDDDLSFDLFVHVEEA